MLGKVYLQQLTWLQEEEARLEAKHMKLLTKLERLEAELDAFLAEELEEPSDEEPEDDYSPLSDEELQ